MAEENRYEGVEQARERDRYDFDQQDSYQNETLDSAGERFFVLFLLVFSFAMIYFMGYGIYKMINRPIPGESSVVTYSLISCEPAGEGQYSCVYVDGEESVTIVIPGNTPILSIPGAEPYLEVTTTPVIARYYPHNQITQVETYHIVVGQ